MKLFLIGMPGSGKSSVGAALAESMDLLFFDLDDLIIAKTGKEISRTFSEEGEDYFRQIESECLSDLIESEESFVCATGGGAPCFSGNLERMEGSGIVVFLEVLLDTLTKRLADQRGTRPLLSGDLQAKVSQLFESRDDCYSKAKVHIDGNAPIQEVVSAIRLEIESQ